MRLITLWLGCAALSVTACAGERLYVAGDAGASLYAVETDGGRVIWEFPLASVSGGAGVAVSPDGDTVYVADGEAPGEFRLRLVDAGSGRETAAYPIEDLLQERGGENPVTLIGEGRWLFVKTYDYGAAASGVRVFDVEGGAFVRTGLRDRACAAPELGAGGAGSVWVGCSRLLERLDPMPSLPGEWRQAASVAVDLETVDALAASGDAVVAAGHLLPGRPLQVVRWDGGGDVQRVSLEAPADRSRRSAAAVSPDGSRIAVAAGERVFVLDSELTLVAERSLSWTAAPRLSFSRSGDRLYVAREPESGAPVQPLELLELGRDGEPRRTITLDGVRLRGSVTALTSAATP